jgi:site-specific DNA recombinase
MCNARPIRTELLDVAVWREVIQVLEDPERLVEEYRRRLEGPKQSEIDEVATIQSQLSRLQQGLGRLIDSFASGLITREEFEPRVGRMRERITVLQAEAEARADQDQLGADLRLIVGQLEQFTSKVKEGIDCADNETKRDIIRALVKRIEIAERQVNVVFRVDRRPFDHRPSGGVLQFCWYNQRSPDYRRRDFRRSLGGLFVGWT